MNNAAAARLAPDRAAPHGEGDQRSGRWRAVQVLFWVAVALTLAGLLAPADAVLQTKVWVASWLPMASAIDSFDATANSDKLVHGSLFAVLGALAARSWTRPHQRWRALAGLLLLGVLTEALQSLIPGRSASLGDWLADAVGAGAGLFVRPLAPAQLPVPQETGVCKNKGARGKVLQKRP